MTNEIIKGYQRLDILVQWYSKFHATLFRHKLKGCWNDLFILGLDTDFYPPVKYIHLNLSHIQQICSRPLWEHLSKIMVKLYEEKFNYWIKICNHCGIFSFCHNVFKSCLLQRRQNVSACRKELKLADAFWCVWNRRHNE